MLSKFIVARIIPTVSIHRPLPLICCRLRSTKSHFHDVALEPGAQLSTKVPPMARMPTSVLLRSLILTSLMSSKIFLRPALAVMGLVSTSKSSFLNPDRNILLNKLLRWTLYNQFCAGTNKEEVLRTIVNIKKIGYQGVILGYSKEVVLDPNESLPADEFGNSNYSAKCYEAIELWKSGTLETLRMVGPGDFLGVKLTGAGPIAVEAMSARQPMPMAIATAVDEICIATARQISRLWLDAEQQILQKGLDDWAIDMMRKHNRSQTPIIYNTIQGYLKESKANLDHHLTLAAQEGWALGIKLVRGAYIEHETRSLIHDTQADTDRSYDLIADTMLCRRMPTGSGDLPFPKAALFLATHNAASAAKAIATHHQRLLAGQPTVMLECGQIQGMADELGCELVQNHERALEEAPAGKMTAPKVFKCMHWGSVSECMGYLHRRAIENRGAVARTQHMVTALRREVWRRIVG